ncbi:MAG: hypothetical protein DMF86_17080 [Acidobacteria bacterium]|nr:MAG: hypothetical protein DMF86_17080 [Acidobacteriota bacterium]
MLPPALLATLVACTNAQLPQDLLYKGPDVLFCDIQKVNGRHCASADERNTGIALTAAAEALVTGQTSSIGLDFSEAALGRCNGEPEAVEFEGPFPQGTGICLDCAAPAQSVPLAACVNRCEAITTPGVPPTPDVTASCQARTALSANALNTSAACFEAYCDVNNVPAATESLRNAPEPVQWRDLIGVSASGGTLTRTAPTPSDPQVFDAGAASSQTITKGDGYVEVTADETTTARLCGVSSGAPPDTDPSFQTIGYALDLFTDSRYYVFQAGVKQPGGDENGAFGTYAPGQVFRLRVKDRLDGTATVSFARVTATCVNGTPCPDAVFFTSPTPIAYPVRVDSSFREQNGTLEDVRLVRIR